MSVDNLKKVLAFSISLAEKVDDITQDGWQWSDAVALFPNLVDAIGAIKSSKLAWEEYMDLDEDEQNDILAFVKAEFDIADDDLENVVESALSALVAIANLILVAKEALKK